jgi:ERCC4-type nuclease
MLQGNKHPGTMSDSHYDYFRVSLLPGIGSRRGRSLLHEFHSFTDLCKASVGDLLRVDGFSQQMARNIFAALREERCTGAIERAAATNATLAVKRGFRFLSLADPSYPPRSTLSCPVR